MRIGVREHSLLKKKEKEEKNKQKRKKGEGQPVGRPVLPGHAPAHPAVTGPGAYAIRAEYRGLGRPIRPKCRPRSGPPGAGSGPTGHPAGLGFLLAPRAYLPPGCWAGPTGMQTGLSSAQTGRPAWQPAGPLF